jgi:hypothetical protein
MNIFSEYVAFVSGRHQVNAGVSLLLRSNLPITLLRVPMIG